jgi:hypothetical protein
VTEATGSSTAPTAAVALAAFKGQEAEAFELIEAGTKDAERRGEGQRLTFFHWATALLCNSLGRYREALAAAQQASSARRRGRACIPQMARRSAALCAACGACGVCRA